jgi:hypothetical protein
MFDTSAEMSTGAKRAIIRSRSDGDVDTAAGADADCCMDGPPQAAHTTAAAMTIVDAQEMCFMNGDLSLLDDPV